MLDPESAEYGEGESHHSPIRNTEQQNVQHQCSRTHIAVGAKQPQRVNLAQHGRHNDYGQRYHCVLQFILHEIVEH